MDCIASQNTGRCRQCGTLLHQEATKRNCKTSGSALTVSVDFSAASQRSALASGPGTELSKLLKRFGVEPTPTCACRAKANEMDAWGCDECSKPERIEEVVGVMREEAKARGLPFLDVAARLLVKRAIHNARKAEARRAKEAEQAAAEGPAA
jgi:hypothetical protein